MRRSHVVADAAPLQTAGTNGFLSTAAPRLPVRSKRSIALQLAATACLHAFGAASLLLLAYQAETGSSPGALPSLSPAAVRVPSRLVFIAPTLPPGGGGGGGGNRQSGPIRRAHGIGHDALTLRTATRPIATAPGIESEPAPPAILLDARSLASGTFDQIGLPEAGVPMGVSTGPGSGGGVGTGSGTGIGAGTGPGFGPGSGGGIGGGAYRPGGAVTAPRLLSRVNPRYTAEALSAKVEGEVWLEVVVTRDGHTADIRVQRPLDAGLDEEAIAAVRRWQFEPGRLAGSAVDVLVTVVLDFQIR